MKFLLTALVASVPLLMLSACGGGGSDPAAPVIPAPPGLLASGLDVTEFLGTWIRNDSANCYTSNEYGNYYFKNNNVVITADSLTSTGTFYSDSLCTAKAGKLSETSSIVYSAATISGKTNVVRVVVTFTGSTFGPDGGTGLTFTKAPDGTLSGTKTPNKSLLDVENNKLYPSLRSSPLDAEGYPTAVNYSGTFFAR